MNKIYIDLKVSDIGRSRQFYQAIGYEAIKMYNTQESSVYKINEDVFFMIYIDGALDHHLKLSGVDMSKYQCSSFSIAASSKQEIDDLIARVEVAGGCVYPQAHDNEMIYGHGFKDPDGNIWDLFVFKNYA